MLRREQHLTHWVLWLDAPTTRNALTADMVQAIHDALTETAEHPGLRAVVLRGVGGHFCAGGDFSSFQHMMATPAPAQGTDPIAIANRAFGQLLQQLQRCEVMTVAVVQGAAMGGGCGLAASCDLVLADHSAMFGTPELGLGLPPAQIAPFLQMRLGTPRSMQMLMHTQRLNAQQALELGLVDGLSEDVDAALHTWTQHWQHAEPAALRSTVHILRKGQPNPQTDATLDFAAEQFARSLRSGTAAEGLAARQAKRPARWTLP
ncbi:MAG: enoyl-CoA hydratase/isomerase family protein [Burkholderiales bacterium]|nr:enoyl-CoA hydratase/isomerase family protein [Burkholderiales bacterium]